jgi:hypothetical protein
MKVTPRDQTPKSQPSCICECKSDGSNGQLLPPFAEASIGLNISILASEAEAERALAQVELLFVINIHPNFDRSIDRAETPLFLVDSDATDPTAIRNAAAALPALAAIPNRDLPPVCHTEPSAASLPICGSRPL